jgi:peptidoglycan hydrolase-like protein with peptidoglycan-binding domain
MMNRIVWHHTGGTYTPNGTDKRAYHRLIDGDGQVHDGVFEIEANAPGKIRRDAYAAHVWNLNTGSIGLAICAMGRGVWSDPSGGRWPVKPVQVDALVLETVRLCRAYGIPVNGRTVLSHAEVEPTLGVKQRNKWDFDYPIRTVRSRDPIAIGDELRQEVMRAMAGAGVAPRLAQWPVLYQGARGVRVEGVQRRLGITTDGIFGPNTRSAVVTFQRRNGLLPDGVVGPATWAALSIKP